MDRLEQNVLGEFDELIDLFTLLRFDFEALWQFKDAEWRRETQFIERVCYHYNEDALSRLRLLTSALRMRHAALSAGNFPWYCAATYALCHDWGQVEESVSWCAWGCSHVLDDRCSRLLGVFAAVVCPTPDRLLEAAKVLAPDDPQGALDRVDMTGLIRLSEQGRFVTGPRAPRPSL